MIDPWKLLEEKKVFENEFVAIDCQKYLLPNGKISDYYIRDGKGHVASMLALTPDRRFVLAREFRPGPGKILDELPGGLIDQREAPLEAAERELLEETGYEGNFIFLGETYLSAYSKSKKFCFLALNCELVSDQSGNHHENEFIEVVLKDEKNFRDQVRKGELTDLETALLGLQFLEQSS